MSRFIIGGFQFAVRSIISFSRGQIQAVMAAAGSNSEPDIQDNLEKDDTVLCKVSDSDDPSDAEQSNGNTATASLSKTSNNDSGDSCSPKQQFSFGSGSRMSVLGQDKDHSLCEIFVKEQPKCQFHFGLWNNSEKGYGTRQRVISEEKG